MASMNDISQDLDDLSMAKSYKCDAETCSKLIKHVSKSLIIITQNIRSIHKNIDGFISQLTRLTFEPDVIVLTECWLSEDKPPPTLEMYSCYFTKKSLNQNDGIVIYVKHEIRCTVVEPEPVGANFLQVSIGADIVILAVYRSPSFYCIDNFLNSVDSLLRTCKRKNIVLIGDINIDIKQNTTDRNSSPYLNLTAELGLLPGHTFPTRINNCLDHIMIKTSLPARIVVMESTVTDHDSVLLSLSYKRKQLKSHQITKTDFVATIKQLESIDFSFISPTADAEQAATLFVDAVSSAIKSNTKTITVSARKIILKPWITPGLLRCIRHRDKLHINAKKNPGNQILEKTYRRYRNFCNTLLRRLKRCHEKTILQNARSNKETWSAIKSITGTTKQKAGADDLLNIQENPSEAVETVNQHFASAGRLLADNISLPSGISRDNLNYTNTSHTLNSMALLKPDEGEIESLIMNLKNDSAVGWDSISNKFLKMSKHIIVPVFTTIVSLCFEQGIFPRVFKRALITPVHKSGARDSVTNYRPISVLPALSKVLEKLLNRQLVGFLENNHILSNCQFGFRAGRSTDGAVSSLVEHITSCLDNKKKCVGIFIDLAKAFDTVSIPILVDKLERIGIRGTVLKIFADFLSSRQQKVKINQYVSSDAAVTCGVPQGSILGPSLFLVYINDLCQMSLHKGIFFTYADDTAIVFQGDTWDEVRHNAEEGLHMVQNWLRLNLLTLNVSKTSLVQFSNSRLKQPNCEIRIHTCKFSTNQQCSCQIIAKTSTVRYLGVLLDEKVTWQPHIGMITARVRKLIWVFKNLRHVANLELLRSVYYALAQSVIGYCIGVWGGACKTHIIQLERAQRSLLKTMTFKPYRFPTKTLFEICKVLTVRQLFIYNIITHKHASTPYDSKKFSNKRKIISVINSVRCHTALGRRQKVFLSVHLYNKLNNILNFYPLSLRECQSKLRDWLLRQDYEETEKVLQ